MQILDRIGIALFSNLFWAAQMAQFLGAPPRTMQRIAQAAREGRSYPVPPEWFVTLRANLRNRAAQFSSLADELDALVEKPASASPNELPELLSAKGGYICWERSFPHGALKADVYSAREADGRLLVMREPPSGIPAVTRAMVDAWVHEGRLKAGVPFADSVVIFWPT